MRAVHRKVRVAARLGFRLQRLHAGDLGARRGFVSDAIIDIRVVGGDLPRRLAVVVVPAPAPATRRRRVEYVERDAGEAAPVARAGRGWGAACALRASRRWQHPVARGRAHGARRRAAAAAARPPMEESGSGRAGTASLPTPSRRHPSPLPAASHDAGRPRHRRPAARRPRARRAAAPRGGRPRCVVSGAAAAPEGRIGG